MNTRMLFVLHQGSNGACKTRTSVYVPLLLLVAENSINKGEKMQVVISTHFFFVKSV